MDPLATADVISGFSSSSELFDGLGSDAAARLIAATADVALVVDGDGVVIDLSYSASEPSPPGFSKWVGKSWLDLVTSDSKHKVAALLRDATPTGPSRSREINIDAAGGADIPIRFSAIRISGGDRVLALGRDLRSVAGLQQKLVEAQMSLEREYSRIRSAETRYRLLFQLSTEAVLIIDDSTERVAEANGAAAKIIGETAQRIVGRSFAELFDAKSATNVRRVIATARTLGHAERVRLNLVGDGAELLVSASVFRQETATHFLVRLIDATSERATLDASPVRSQALDAIMKMPDGFVIIDDRQRILDANPAFLSLVELVAIDGLRGARLDAWLGRPGVEAPLLISNLREHGSLKDFATIIRGEFGSIEQVEVTGVAASGGDRPCYGLIIRSVRRRAPTPSTEPSEGFRSVEQLTQLVGRVSLKELVRESTDLVEKLCIEAALKRTDDNRASAAQILGLSRQSLYSKLHRHGLVGEDESPDDA